MHSLSERAEAPTSPRIQCRTPAIWCPRARTQGSLSSAVSSQCCSAIGTPSSIRLAVAQADHSNQTTSSRTSRSPFRSASSLARAMSSGRSAPEK